MSEHKTEEEQLVDRVKEAFHQRHLPHHDKAKAVNDLARFYRRQGLITGYSPGENNQITEKLTGAVGISKRALTNYLDEEFKLKAVFRGGRSKRTRKKLLKGPEISSDAKAAVDAVVEVIRPTVKELAKVLSARHEHGNLQDNMRFISSVLKSIETGHIYCPRHKGCKGMTLVWSCCGTPLDKSIEEIRRELDANGNGNYVPQAESPKGN
jgi:hypothetical protein